VPRTAETTESDRRPGAARAWDTFFFTSADPRPLACIRIATGLLLLWSFLWLGADLSAWLGPEGWIDPGTAREMLPPTAWSFWLWLPPGLIAPAYGLVLAVLVAFTLGFASPVSAALAWAAVASTNRRVPIMLFGFDSVVATWAFYLAVSTASGQAFSLDRLLRRRRRGGPDLPTEPTVSANLGLRLIQLHLCLIYASAGLAKLQGTPWWDGSALGMLLGNSDFRPFDLDFVADFPSLLQLGTHLTIALELLYPILIWLPAWRPWMLLGALGMHASIALSMGLTEFSLVMLVGNLAFVPPRWFHAASIGLGRLRGVKSTGSARPSQALEHATSRPR
jgi:hypothetical protein